MPHSRRSFLGLMGLSSSAFVAPWLLTACGSEDDSADTTASPTPGQTVAASASPSAAATVARRTSSSGTLRVSEPFLPATLDSDAGASSANNLVASGVAETLTRYTPGLRVEPWMAKSIERKDLLTWVITLRDDLAFWDGTKVDAEAVRQSLLRSIEKQPGTADQLPPTSTLAASGLVLTITTPAPLGLLPNNLANAAFAIKKVTGDQFIYTGPFRNTAFTARETMTLEAFDGYRGGPANIKTIQLRQVGDTAARSLALQAGDVDIAQALLPSDVAKLKAQNLQVSAAPWARQHMLILNVTQAPLNDVAVRKAFSLSIDREALVKGILDGVGAAAFGFAPEGIGLEGIIRTQKFNLDEAKSTLEAAGWKAGAGGIREKSGQRLAFKIGTYPGRAELEQMAIVIVDMAKAAGIELSIEKFTDVEQAIAANAFQSTTYSIGSAAFGDLSRLLATLYVPSSRNKDRYSNPTVNSLFTDYLQNSDLASGASMLKRMQEAIGADYPVIHLVNPFQVVGASRKLKDFTPHPLDQYKYTAEMRLDA